MLFNALFSFVISFPPRSKCVLISWLQSSSSVILEHPKIKSVSRFSSLSRIWLFQHNGLQLARFPCPSPTPGAISNSFPSHRWCHPTISSSDFLEDGLALSPCSPGDSQESSPTPQIKNINSSALSFLYSPTLTPIHDYWKNHTLTRWPLLVK